MNPEALRATKGNSKVAMLTAYDYPTARLLDEAGIDVLLVGDSLGMVVLGFPDTTHVTMADMIHHTSAVARGAKHALIVADLPINSYETEENALLNAKSLINAGAGAVKLEGGQEKADIIAALTRSGIPVVAHIGMLPQQVLIEGGYKIKGKTPSEANRLEGDIHAVVEAGACAVVLEGIKGDTATKLTEISAIPTIGIGCGNGICDGEVAVISDLIGAYPWFIPAFAKPKANVAEIVSLTVKNWISELRK